MAEEKYAVGEYERRFLLDEIPAGATDPRRIVDRYIDNTRLRLRTVDHPGAEMGRKLGHKRRLNASDPRAIIHTSVHLEEDEFSVLAALPAKRLVKTRWSIEVEGRQCSINVFEGPLAGLILMAVDLGDPSLLDEFVPPSWAGAEVSTDEAFTGGELAGKSLNEIVETLNIARLRTAR